MTPSARALPALLIAFRVVAGPLLLVDALDGEAGAGFVVLFLAAFLSDVLDGVIARRLGVASAGLRRADSLADLVLYACVFASAWLVHRDVVLAFRWPLAAVVATLLAAYAVSLIKFGRPPSYHAYSAKAWGLLLGVATVALFGFGYAGLALWGAILGGVVNNLEDVAITLVLPRGAHDIPTLAAALRLRAAGRSG
ncbi:MAG: CDP-alcohol phosphatidyltransferase family protein [Candidatus Rokubacteria bacterium]|nr:CDP-alcohol phosphatidyltransferase family protein [Candidatus Rokubacteria bacterium]MBI3824440.1 CDP-alcohol phosphatidyltransferase family protein [Candidatus Rokubacteria bacterium]